MSFYILPRLGSWAPDTACKRNRISSPGAIGSKALTLTVSLAGVVFLIPYLQLQLTGLGIIVSGRQLRQYSPRRFDGPIHGAGGLFVLAGGMRAVAWVSVLKDLLMILVALAIGIYVPAHYFGGIAPMFDRLLRPMPRISCCPALQKP